MDGLKPVPTPWDESLAVRVSLNVCNGTHSWYSNASQVTHMATGGGKKEQNSKVMVNYCTTSRPLQDPTVYEVEATWNVMAHGEAREGSEEETGEWSG